MLDLQNRYLRLHRFARKVVERMISNIPRVLTNTTTSRLYDELHQAVAFEELLICNESRSSMIIRWVIYVGDKQLVRRSEHIRSDRTPHVPKPINTAELDRLVTSLQSSFTVSPLSHFPCHQPRPSPDTLIRLRVGPQCLSGHDTTSG